MNISSFKMMMHYTAYTFRAGRKNFVNNFVDNTKNDVINFVDLLSGKKQLQVQYELARLNNQINLIERNLNNSLSNSPQCIDIIR